MLGNLKGQLQEYLERITQPVEIVASLDESDRSREMLAALADIQSVCDRIKIEVLPDHSAKGGEARADAPLAPSFGLRPLPT